MAFLYLGAKHMVTGYDHLLFLFGVIFFLYRMRDVGALRDALRRRPQRDAALRRAERHARQRRIWSMRSSASRSSTRRSTTSAPSAAGSASSPTPRRRCSSSGSIHGFGLATKLQDFALPRAGLAPKIVAFNAGVEIGQLLALARHPHRHGLLAAHGGLLAPGVRRQRDRDDLRLRADGLSAHRLGSCPSTSPPAMRHRLRPHPPIGESAVVGAPGARDAQAAVVAAGPAASWCCRPSTASTRPASAARLGPVSRSRERGREPLPASGRRRASAGAGHRLAVHSPTPYRTDEMSITLAAGEGAEIKAQMAAGERLVYSWTATGNGVDVDMHGEAIDKAGGDRSYQTGRVPDQRPRRLRGADGRQSRLVLAEPERRPGDGHGQDGRLLRPPVPALAASHSRFPSIRLGYTLSASAAALEEVDYEPQCGRGRRGGGRLGRRSTGHRASLLCRAIRLETSR